MTLSWNVFQGGLTRHQISEAGANVANVVAQIEQGAAAEGFTVLPFTPILQSR